MKYTVKPTKNENIEVTSFLIIDENTSTKNFIRKFLVLVLMVILIALLIGTAVYGWIHDDFSGLKDVALYSQFFMNGFLVYYFKSG